MKTLITISAFMFLFLISKGQDSIRRFEFGSTLVTINSFNNQTYNEADRPQFEFINGLFFRYNKKRFGLRAHASYSDNYSNWASPPQAADGASGDANNKDIRIGVGGQFSLLKRKKWFYTFADLSYRNLFSTGHYYGGIGGANDKFSRSGNGLDAFFGLGFKIKTFKNVFLSPEIGFLLANKSINTSSTSMISGQIVKYNYSQTDFNSVIKLHLTVKF